MAMIQALGNVSKVRGALDLRRGHRGGDAVLPRRDRAAPPVPHAEVRPVRRDAGNEPVADRGRLRLGRAEGLPTRRRRARAHRRQPPPRDPRASTAAGVRHEEVVRTDYGLSSASCGIRRATRSSSTSRRSPGPTSTPSGCPLEFAPELGPPRRGGAHRGSRRPGRGHRDRLRSRQTDTAGQRAGRDRVASVTVGGRPLLAGPIRRGRPVAARRDRPVPARPVAQVDRQRPDHAVPGGGRGARRRRVAREVGAVARRGPRRRPGDRQPRRRFGREAQAGRLQTTTWFRDWRDSFDAGVCAPGGRRDGQRPERRSTAGPCTSGRASGGVHTYHVHLEGRDVDRLADRRRRRPARRAAHRTPCPTDGRTGRAAAYPRTDDRRSTAGRRRPPRPRPARHRS